MPGSEQSVRITMSDGVELAASLYLPDADQRQPCLLEALPYRKDDLTSSYAESYRSLRDEHGYAVCRVDVRGTGSSGGDATDEYPEVETSDLTEVIAWLASQDWCDGGVGMFGTSYSGFNSLQVACERPPALKAVCAIYASDDRWSDDVHWRGHALKLLDLLDYCHYMTAMNLLPPVPAEWGEGWREEWRRRVSTNDPWVLTWLRENRDGSYWRAGSVRRPDGSGRWSGYERITCPVMIVGGWADGYRNNSFRTVEALRRAGVPHRLLTGPWAHADPAAAIPGPRIDLDREMVAWFDTWLRGPVEEPPEDRLDVFVRTSTRPAPDLEMQEGYWASLEHANVTQGADVRPSSTADHIRRFEGLRTLQVEPDVGTAAWIDCAGHLPWGLSEDQRGDDARSLTWEWDPPVDAVVGQPRVRLRISSSAPAASLSVKLCDVFADGTSALVTRGTLDLAFRDGPSPSPLEPGVAFDVVLDLDACAYHWEPGQRLRLSVAGADWPNTIAPPAPLTLTLHEVELELPTPGHANVTPVTAERTTSTASHIRMSKAAAPAFAAGAESSDEEVGDTVWAITDDVLRRTTTCVVRHGSTYDIPGGAAGEEYAGEVVVDRRTFAQHASADCTYQLQWEGVDVRVSSTMRVDVGPEDYDVVIEADAFDGAEQIAHREWAELFPR